MIAYLLLLRRVAKKSRARGFLSNSLCRSAGTAAALCGSYARAHLPSFFACSTAASPGSFIRLTEMRETALSRLMRDHTLFGPRGVNFWSHHDSSSFFF